MGMSRGSHTSQGPDVTLAKAGSLGHSFIQLMLVYDRPCDEPVTGSSREREVVRAPRSSLPRKQDSPLREEL
jgi:hypothetical protein